MFTFPSDKGNSFLKFPRLISGGRRDGITILKIHFALKDPDTQQMEKRVEKNLSNVIFALFRKHIFFANVLAGSAGYQHSNTIMSSATMYVL